MSGDANAVAAEFERRERREALRESVGPTESIELAKVYWLSYGVAPREWDDALVKAHEPAGVFTVIQENRRSVIVLRPGDMLQIEYYHEGQ